MSACPVRTQDNECDTPAMGKLNVPLYRASRGRLFGKLGRAPVLLLTTTGRRSAQQRTAPVLYLADGERLVVIGSNAGYAQAPAWSLNLKANPACAVQVRGDRKHMRARVAEGEERAKLWQAMNEQYDGFDEYEERTARDIAVFVLEPHEQAGAPASIAPARDEPDLGGTR
jgi:deazaflavin-dependent oxidoreductase (nitroreductase family)